ncbi:MAG: IS256 family transposase [Ilumatobacter sp.]|jgi:putative transposase|uniref:IS256 family transposase n=1 Tax=Ilumatobacter sp. TaxID=1967498 RepID=UPI002A61B1DD|nr:IS256 family transposase [Ilumatobacter sp.]MDG1784387.1 IS256 family transposase [Ilumatobacter sp.]
MTDQDVAVATPPNNEDADRPERSIAEQLVEQARTDGVDLVGPGGLLSNLTKQVLETGLEVEMEEHLGYEKHAAEGRNGENSRNGTRSKTVITEVGPVDLEVPRDRDGSFEPKTVKKRQRRLDGVDSMVISLTAKGLTTGEVEAHLMEVYSTNISRETISKITDRVLDEMADWQNRPLDRVYPVIFIDALVVKIRDGQVANRPVYAAIGVTVDGKRDILGLWVGTGGEGAKYWLQVLTEIKNRGVEDACMVVCDGLKGLPESIEATWPLAIVQTCVLHLIRNTFRLASRADWDKMARDLRPVYTAVNEADAASRLDEFHDIWGQKYPAIKGLWSSAWAEFVPFLDYSPEIRRVIYSTNAIESLNARFRRATRARGHFPNEQAALKCLYMVVRSLDPKGTGQERWMNRWKPALNAFAITFEGRLF